MTRVKNIYIIKSEIIIRNMPIISTISRNIHNFRWKT